MKREFFNVAHLESHSHIYGPGTRFVVWLQGCSLACSGCWNQDMWSFADNRLMHREELLLDIIHTKDIDGITILGGEPLQQSENTVWLLSKIREMTDKTCILYTGYTDTELRTMRVYEILDTVCDILIVGRYEKKNRSVFLQWRGSTNQKVMYTSNSRIEERPKLLNEVELIIDSAGGMTALGYPQ